MRFVNLLIRIESVKLKKAIKKPEHMDLLNVGP